MLFVAALIFTGCSNGSDSGGGTPPTPPPKHAITFSVDSTTPNGTLKATVGGAEISSGDKVEQGKTIVFTATPDSGFHVKGWTLDGKAVNGTNSSYSFTVTKAAEVKVSFESNSTPLPQYAVNFSVEGGNGTLKAKADGVPETETSPINVEKGKTVTFTAVPAAGYEVKEWQIFGTGMVFEAGTGTAGNNTAKVNLKGNLTVKVSFKVQTLTSKHKVTMIAGANGSISAEPALPADGMVNEDTIITFTAASNEGYTVDAWTITGGHLEAGGQAGSSTAMVKITEPVTVAVSFKLKPPTTYTVSFGVDGTPPNGTISATYKTGGVAFTSGTAVAENTVLVFTASPDTGYKVEKWTVNGTAVPGNTSTTYEHTVTQLADIRVSFVPSVTIPDNFTLSNGAEYKVVDKEQKHVIMTKRGNDPVGTVYTVAVTVGHEGITYTLTGFSRECVSEFRNLTSLEAFALSGETAFLSVDGGVLFDKAKTKLIRYPKGKTGTSYRVPDGVTVLGYSSFESNSTLTAIMLPTTGLTTIEDGALYCCYELKTVNIPSTLTSIGSAFLGYSKVEDVKIPEGVTELDNLFLNNCEELKTLELPSTFTEHLRGDFCKNCTALQSVTCMAATPPALGGGAFSGVVLAGVTLKVPAASVSAYEGAPIWKDFGTITAITP
ncbi:leucine rich repeat protein [Treponema socranskii subsp. socranskii VPI DR56BR1116 = ATCC 35536]|uniref:Leucine rich repeat protein n=2 Tax=Treponema socranskii subsp. socranskii VPI DR56BR1116 = ATCC 35536 TaxID=1125725 RepID=U1FLQ6_TRESO|nr:leucine-rich repeat protein [Treponema socranskii]ERF60773.1 leucine rich repeat protein [Treponema socranskii subsp. socranskii VPI DR56BR1116 = ATCC 35536]